MGETPPAYSAGKPLTRGALEGGGSRVHPILPGEGLLSEGAFGGEHPTCEGSHSGLGDPLMLEGRSSLCGVVSCLRCAEGAGKEEEKLPARVEPWE